MSEVKKYSGAAIYGYVLQRKEEQDVEYVKYEDVKRFIEAKEPIQCDITERDIKLEDICPSCNVYICTEHPNEYCFNCGQRLKWRQ